MEELNTPIFAQAKVEYTSQLVDILYPHMFDGVKSIYDESKLLYRSKGTAILLIFRELLEKVPIWNGEIIDSECSRIINNSNCDYIEDLITAVFISHTKILTSIGQNKSFQKINLTIPKTGTFVHKCYIIPTVWYAFELRGLKRTHTEPYGSICYHRFLPYFSFLIITFLRKAHLHFVFPSLVHNA